MYPYILIIFSAIAFYQIMDLIKQKRTKEVIAYVAVLLPGLVTLILLSLGVEVPDYHDVIKKIVAPLTEGMS